MVDDNLPKKSGKPQVENQSLTGDQVRPGRVVHRLVGLPASGSGCGGEANEPLKSEDPCPGIGGLAAGAGGGGGTSPLEAPRETLRSSAASCVTIAHVILCSWNALTFQAQR